MLTGFLYRLCRTRGGIGRTSAVPLTRICKTQTVVVGDSIVHPNAIFVVDTVAAVGGFVTVSRTLLSKWMVSLMLHLPVTRSIGIGVRRVYSQFAMIIDDASARITRSIFVLSPTAHQLS